MVMIRLVRFLKRHVRCVTEKKQLTWCADLSNVDSEGPMLGLLDDPAQCEGKATNAATVGLDEPLTEFKVHFLRSARDLFLHMCHDQTFSTLYNAL